MKRILTCLLLVLAVQLTWASSVNSIFHEFKEERNAEYVSVSPFLLWIGRLAMGNEDEATKDIMKKVKSLRVLDLEDCSTAVKERFAKRIGQLKEDKFESLVRINEDGEKVNILVQQKGDEIRELLIVCCSPDDCALVDIRGNFKESDLNRLIEMNN